MGRLLTETAVLFSMHVKESGWPGPVSIVGKWYNGIEGITGIKVSLVLGYHWYQGIEGITGYQGIEGITGIWVITRYQGIECITGVEDITGY